MSVSYIKLQHSKPRAKLENLRVHFGSRHFLTKLYTNLKITEHLIIKKENMYIDLLPRTLFHKEMQINYCIVLA